MKIILSNEEFSSILEKFRALHDPDNALSLKDIIDNYRTNQLFTRPLIMMIVSSLFTGVSDEAGATDSDVEDWLEYTFSEEIFIDNLLEIQVIGESCDIVLTFQ